MEAEREVFTEFFEELVAAVENDTLTISNVCLSEKLITRSRQRRILDTPGSEEKATVLITAVSDCIRHQKDGFNKFLDILKGQVIFDELVSKLREAKDRKHTAEERTTSDKQSLVLSVTTPIPTTPILRKEMPSHSKSAEKKAIKKYLPQLSSQVQRIIAAVAITSETKQVITKATYKKAMRKDKSPKERTQFLLHSVCKCVRTDTKKFNMFLEILSAHRSCKEVVRLIEEEIHLLREEAVAASVKEEHDHAHTAPQLWQRKMGTQPKPSETDKLATYESGEDNKSKMVFSSGETSAVRVQNVVVNPQAESEHFLRMDKKQSEALLLDSERQKTESNELCEQEVKDLSQKIDQLEQGTLEKDGEINGLKQSMLEKDQEIQALREERDNFQLAMNCMKVRVSLVEKEQCNTNTEVLEKRVTELEKKIVELGEEKKTLSEEKMALVEQKMALVEQKMALQEQLSFMNQELRDRDASLTENKTVLEATQTTMRESQHLVRTLKAVLDTRDRKYYCIKMAVIVFVILFLSIILGVFLFSIFHTGTQTCH